MRLDVVILVDLLLLLLLADWAVALDVLLLVLDLLAGLVRHADPPSETSTCRFTRREFYLESSLVSFKNTNVPVILVV
jgi:hypothetical protein